MDPDPDSDPDPHGSAFIFPSGSGFALRKAAGSGSVKNECGSTALIIRIVRIV